MKKLIYHLVLLQSLFFGLATASAKSLAANGDLQESVTPNHGSKQTTTTSLTDASVPQWAKSKVWVMNGDKGDKKIERQPYIWVVPDSQKIGQQPYLQLTAKSNDTDKKPTSNSKPSKKDKLEAFEKIIKDTKKQSGLFTLYRNSEKNKIYLEIKPEQLNKNFLATATLESGIGEKGIYSGIPLQDFLFYFQKVDNNLNFVVRNVNFRTRDGDPQVRSLARSFSDSILYTIEIKSIHPTRNTILIDLEKLLLQDVAGLSASLQVVGSQEGSYFGNAKVFPQNMEIETVLNFSGSGDNTQSALNSLADSRGFTLRVHYSLSQLPQNNYRPRFADERVGYFITAYQDLSNDDRNDPFVRYINRWHLEKKDPKAAISPPKKPIVFWIDNAVPFQYRDAIKEGVLMWNQAFEIAGFKDAIQVRQMPDNATWEPADIRYNTIRWINTVDGYFAMGPSRVNPLTGEILDADILIDSSFVRSLKSNYRQIVQPSQKPVRTSLTAWMQNRLLCSKGFATPNSQTKNPFTKLLSQMAGKYDLCYGMEAVNQFAFGSLAMSLLQEKPPSSEQMKQYIHQYLKLIIAHEVGHTLGLRHNFRGSTLLSPKQMHNPNVTATQGLVSSVMDYIPPNIAPPGSKQGNFFPTTVGLYDIWAIRYGYTPIKAASPIAEKPFLNQIAQQSYKPEYSYSTDEDIYDLDPTANPWDNSNDVLLYSQWQLDNARLMWNRLNQRYPLEGDSFSDVRDRFGTVLGNYFQNVYYTSKYIGGQSFYRVHAGNPQGQLPFQPVPLEQQRQALQTLQKYVFAEDAFNFAPQLLNKLAPSRWRHWGMNPKVGRLDYPIHDLVLFFQSSLLQDLLSSDRLSRLKDIELKTEKDKALSLPELFDTLQTGIWTEVLKPKKNKPLVISSLRRGLQREYLDLLSNMVLRKQSVPEDARTLAWYKLRQLNEKLDGANSKDEYTKAHLLESRDRIKKVLDAPLQGN
ncbi:MAG: zinc-dependent metalloprotease [Nostocaceae cyanobacterium]|nr:zinc-dependent metalloprotease [Nostocaceae cyanobacterium]